MPPAIAVSSETGSTVRNVAADRLICCQGTCSPSNRSAKDHNIYYENKIFSEKKQRKLIMSHRHNEDGAGTQKSNHVTGRRSAIKFVLQHMVRQISRMPYRH
jgi:hypothetical protein